MAEGQVWPHPLVAIFFWSEAGFTLTITVELNSCNRDHGVHLAENIYGLALYRESLP